MKIHIHLKQKTR